MNIGYRQGFNAGRNDRANGERFNYRDEFAFRNANNAYREGFRRGYEEGYRTRFNRGILGGFLGRY